MVKNAFKKFLLYALGFTVINVLFLDTEMLKAVVASLAFSTLATFADRLMHADIEEKVKKEQAEFDRISKRLKADKR